MAKTWLVTWTWDCRRIPTHFRMALSQWEWPKQLLQSCRRRTSRWRVCECSPGAQEPCSSACRHLSRKLMAPCGSSCETPPLWVCSTPDMWPGRGLRSTEQRNAINQPVPGGQARWHRNKHQSHMVRKYTLMWKFLSTKMFSGLMSLCMTFCCAR